MRFHPGQKQYPGALDTSGKKALSSRATARRAAMRTSSSVRSTTTITASPPALPREHSIQAFFTTDNVAIVNYPKLHIKQCEDKNQNTKGNFKAAVRIHKNMRNRLIGKGLLANGIAPSYYIEGLLHNVPDDVFTGTYQTMVLGSYRWVRAADGSKLWCANGMRPLLLDERLDIVTRSRTGSRRRRLRSYSSCRTT